MARVRRAGEDPIVPTRGPEGTALSALLSARRFRLGAGTERVAENLRQHGGDIAPDAAAVLTSARPPDDAPSVGLGESPGTLGPNSFGFLNNVGSVAPLDAPLPSLPRRGSLALVVPTRGSLPDLGPLTLGRGFGVSFLVSVGDGDPAETLAFLAADPATTSLAVVLGSGARGASLRSALGAKPSVIWGGDPVCRAVARRAGARVVDRIGEWLAHAALLDGGLEPGGEVTVVVVGGGHRYVSDEVRAHGLSARVLELDDRSPEALLPLIEKARTGKEALVLVAGGPPFTLPTFPAPGAGEEPDLLRLLAADLRHPEHFSALVAALARTTLKEPPAQGRARVDKALVARVRNEVDALLSDHDAKRLLKAYGARVTRQAPTATPTGVAKLARTIGMPVELVRGSEVRVAETLPEARRLASLLLQEADKATPASVMVRERFPEAPRARVRVIAEKGLGLTMRIGEACALLPVSRADALELAQATAARRAPDQRAVAELLGKISACAIGEDATFEIELYVGADPVVLNADGALRRP